LNRPLIISISGKGGTGKTTLTALLLKVLLYKGIDEDILVVDADPAANLPEVLGVKVEKTIGTVVEEFRKAVNDPRVAVGFSKETLLEAWIYETLVELPNYDLLVMGRGEGEGCYCYINAVLTKILSKLVTNYDIVLMDMEAGLEHISRRTDRHVNTMIIVTDPSVMGFKTAERIKELLKEVRIEVEKLYVVGNRFPKYMEKTLISWANKVGIEVAGIIPEDPKIYEYNILGKSLLELPYDSPAVRAAELIAKRIGLLR